MMMNKRKMPKPRQCDYKSSYEKSFAQRLALLKASGQIMTYQHEAITLVVNEIEDKKRRYTPDFAVWHIDGGLEFVEIKGRPREDAIMKFEMAASGFAFHQFTMIGKDKHGWFEMARYNDCGYNLIERRTK
jgi:hypothetical protein